MKKRYVTLVCLLLMIFVYQMIVPAAKEAEKNDSMSSATAIEVNESTQGSLDSKNDEDWYAVTLPKKGYLSLHFKHPVIASTEYYWLIYMYQSDGVTPIYGEDTCWVVYGNEDRIVPQIGLEAGTYYIKIAPYSNYSVLTYTLVAEYEESDVWETEINNTVSKASEITANQDYYGTICTKYDVDYYAVTLSERGYISVHFNHSLMASEGTYWKIYMYQSDGVTPIDDVDAYWKILGNANRTLPEIGLEAGTYYIKVEPYSSDVCEFSMYTLRVDFTESDVWETEINGRMSDADMILLNQSYYGTTGIGDVDWYVLELDSTLPVCLSLYHNVETGVFNGWNVDIYKQDGVTEVEKKLATSTNQTETVYDLGMLSKGQYYIRIVPDSGGIYDAVRYRLHADGTHEHQYAEHTVIRGATCTEDGISTEICSVCGEVKRVLIKELGHQSDEWRIVQEPGCTESGKKERQCSVCGEVVEEEEIPALGHLFDEWKMTQEASCTENGKREKRCSICDEIVETEEITPLGHRVGEWKVIREASRTENGMREQRCEVCGEVLATEEIRKLSDINLIGAGAAAVFVMAAAVIAVIGILKRKHTCLSAPDKREIVRNIHGY